MKNNIRQIQEAIRTAASKETSAIPSYWDIKNPTTGHCAVAALVVQDIFGGELLRASLEKTEFAYGKYHYWNLLPDNLEVDTTDDQFEGKNLNLIGEIKSREDVLSHKSTKVRYKILKKTVLEILSQSSETLRVSFVTSLYP